MGPPPNLPQQSALTGATDGDTWPGYTIKQLKKDQATFYWNMDKLHAYILSSAKRKIYSWRNATTAFAL